MKRAEKAGLALLVILGLAPRLAFVSSFPTIPVSDFNSLVAFGRHLQEHGLLSKSAWFWEFFNPGLPVVLACVFTLYPCVDPGSLARVVTAAVCGGVLPLLPFLIWRGVLPLWTRILAGAALALWPGQIVFSGVVAQDNWVLLPSVALAALAVRVLYKDEDARPVIAGLLYAGGVAMRQEMVVALVPLFVAAAGVTSLGARRRAITAVLAAGLPLLGLAAYRSAATGRFALNTEHSGVSILGAYVPGATINGWTEPAPYIASVRPDLLWNGKALFSQATSVAVREALRRPVFHTLRILSSMADLSITGESKNLYWSLQAPEVLPPALHDRGMAVATLWSRPLRWEMEALQGLFLAAVLIAIRRRSRVILALLLAALLKYGLHAVTVAQGRYLLAATAFEILTVVVAAYEAYALVRLPGGRRFVGQALGAGAIFCWALILLSPQLAGFVISRDVDQQRTYRFPLETPDRGAALTCVVERGILATLITEPWSAAIRPFHSDPAPGEAAVAKCELTGSGEPRPVVLQVLDSYAPGGLGGRIRQRVELDGTEVFSHDIAQEPGTGWVNIPLGRVGAETHKSLTLEVRAIRPDPGMNWGNAAQTDFRMARP